MARTACLVCIISTVSGQKCLGRCGASSRHKTKLKQSIFFRYLWVESSVIVQLIFLS